MFISQHQTVQMVHVSIVVLLLYVPIICVCFFPFFILFLYFVFYTLLQKKTTIFCSFLTIVIICVHINYLQWFSIFLLNYLHVLIIYYFSHSLSLSATIWFFVFHKKKNKQKLNHYHSTMNFITYNLNSLCMKIVIKTSTLWCLLVVLVVVVVIWWLWWLWDVVDDIVVI